MNGVINWQAGCSNSLQHARWRRATVAATNGLCECLLTVGTA